MRRQPYAYLSYSTQNLQARWRLKLMQPCQPEELVKEIKATATRVCRSRRQVKVDAR